MLIEDRRGGVATAGSAPIRRFRLARVRFDGLPVNPQKRFEHLKCDQ
jgi:hypothetical protein